MTMLSLEEWREIIGWNPWHFWGLAGDKAPVTSGCNTAVMQYGWQSADAAGRADIVEAISAAEQTLIEYLGFSPAPRYEMATTREGLGRLDQRWSAESPGRRGSERSRRSRDDGGSGHGPSAERPATTARTASP